MKICNINELLHYPNTRVNSIWSTPKCMYEDILRYDINYVTETNCIILYHKSDFNDMSYDNFALIKKSHKNHIKKYNYI